MRIVVAVKILPDSKDLRAGNDGALDFSHARNVVSEYDLNAIEAAAQLAASHEGSTVKVLSAGPASIDESKSSTLPRTTLWSMRMRERLRRRFRWPCKTLVAGML